MKIGINGFGRIGRLVTRTLIANPTKGKLVAINNPDLSVEYIMYLLKYDSVHGFLRDTVLEKSGNDLLINGKRIRITGQRDPKLVKWDDVDTDVLMECSGKFLTTDLAKVFLENGAKKVLLSAPPKDDTPMYVFGVNCNKYIPSQLIVSNASCTTNCLAPTLKLINDKH